MLRHSDYVRILVRPSLPVTCDGDSLADCEEAKIFDAFKWTQVILDASVILKDLYPTLVDNRVICLMNFKPKCRTHHPRKLRPLTTGNYHRIHGRERHLL